MQAIFKDIFLKWCLKKWWKHWPFLKWWGHVPSLNDTYVYWTSLYILYTSLVNINIVWNKTFLCVSTEVIFSSNLWKLTFSFSFTFWIFFSNEAYFSKYLFFRLVKGEEWYNQRCNKKNRYYIQSSCTERLYA